MKKLMKRFFALMVSGVMVLGTWGTSYGNEPEQTETDYPAFYDDGLANEIPSRIYYATDHDNGWIGSIGIVKNGRLEEFTNYSEEDGTYTTGWLNYEGKWYAFDSDNNLNNKWVSCGGHWYYCNPMVSNRRDCYMVTGWKEIDGKWYYFNNAGQMVANCEVDGCVIGSDGVWVQ